MFEELLDIPQVQGVVRLVTKPSFFAPQFLTLVYTQEAVLGAAFAQGFGLWVEFPLTPGGKASPEIVSRVVPWLSFGVVGFEQMTASRYELTGKCPELIGSWPRVRESSELAVDCCASVLDGESYLHRIFDRAGTIQAIWQNPNHEFPLQAKLLAAYAHFQARAQLTPKQVRQAFDIDDKRESPTSEFDGVNEGDDSENQSFKKRPKPWQRPRR